MSQHIAIVGCMSCVFSEGSIVIYHFDIKVKVNKLNEWDFRSPLWTYRVNRPGEPPENGKMNEMTLPRHRIQNWSPGARFTKKILS